MGDSNTNNDIFLILATGGVAPCIETLVDLIMPSSSNPQIHADPDRIRMLAHELRLFTNALQIDLVSMDEALGHLGSSWKDGEFDKFRNAYRKLSERLKNLAVEINRSEPQLNADADALANFLRLQTPS